MCCLQNLIGNYNAPTLPSLPFKVPIDNGDGFHRRRSSVITRRGTASLHFYGGSQLELGERTGSKLTLDEELYDILYAFGYYFLYYNINKKNLSLLW